MLCFQLVRFPHLFGSGYVHELEFQQVKQRHAVGYCCYRTNGSPVPLQSGSSENKWGEASPPLSSFPSSFSSPSTPSFFFLSSSSSLSGLEAELSQARARQVFFHWAPSRSVFYFSLGLVKLPRLALNWQSSCLILSSGREDKHVPPCYPKPSVLILPQFCSFGFAFQVTW